MEDNTPKRFDWSTVQPAEVLEEPRAYRFPLEWRPLLMQYLGLGYGQERRYWELSQKVRRLVLEHLLPRQGLGSSRWRVRSFFALLSRAGLEGVRMHAWGYCRAPDDARPPPQERLRLREQQYRVAREQLESLRKSGDAEVLFQRGLTPRELEELIPVRPAPGGVWNTPSTTGRRACQ